MFVSINIFFHLFQLLDYQSHDWTGTLELCSTLEDFKAITMISDSQESLSLSIHVDKTNALDLYVYSPYWIINKTMLPIQIRVSSKLYHHS